MGRMIVLLCVAVCCGVAACGGEGAAHAKDDAAYFGRIEPGSLTSSDSEWGCLIKRVTEDGAAKECGLQVGDTILAADGLRVFELREYKYISSLLNSTPNSIKVTIWRNGKVIPLLLKDLRPVRIAGFIVDTPDERMHATLKDLGLPVKKELIEALDQIPVRLIAALQRWIRQHEKAKRDLAWLKEFIKVYGCLVNREYDKVAPTASDIPVPEFARVMAFYQSLAARHAKGEKDPLPSAHGVSMAFYVLNYPMPRHVIPAWGDLAFTDARFQHLLKEQRLRDVWDGQGERKDIAYKSDTRTEHYIGQVKLSLINPKSHDGWPFRSWLVWKPEARKPLMKELQARMEAGDANEALYAYALLCPYLMDGNTEKVKSLFRHIRERSPWLAFVSQRLIRLAAKGHNRQRISYEIQKLVKKTPFAIVPGGNSRFQNAVFDRSHIWARHTAERSISQAFWEQPCLVADALLRKNTIIDEALRLAAKVSSPKFAANREALMQEIVRHERFNTYPKNGQMLLATIRDGQGYGSYVKALSDHLYWSCWSGASSLIQWVELRMLLLPVYFTQEEKTLFEAEEMLRILDWQDRPSALKQIEGFVRNKGLLITTLRLAESLETHDYREEAAKYRARVIDFYRYLTYSHRAWEVVNPKRRHRGHKTSTLFLWHATHALCSSKATSELAISYGKRFARVAHGDTRWLTGYLFLAQACLNLDRVPEATDWLIKSSTGAKDARFLFYMNGRTTTSLEKYVGWLLKALSTHPRFSQELKRRLVSSPLVKKWPHQAHTFLGTPKPAVDSRKDVSDETQEPGVDIF